MDSSDRFSSSAPRLILRVEDASSAWTTHPPRGRCIRRVDDASAAAWMRRPQLKELQTHPPFPRRSVAIPGRIGNSWKSREFPGRIENSQGEDFLSLKVVDGIEDGDWAMTLIRRWPSLSLDLDWTLIGPCLLSGEINIFIFYSIIYLEKRH